MENIKTQMELDDEYVEIVGLLNKPDEEKIQLVDSFSELSLPEKITRMQIAKNQAILEAKNREAAIEIKKGGR